MKAIGADQTNVRRAAVIGAGAMGGGIAAQFANAGIEVELLDIPGVDDRNSPAAAGISRQLKIGGFMSPDAANLVRAGNIEDHLERLVAVDWVIEAIVEKIEVKRDLFDRIAPHLHAQAILSSNTSTIPRAELVAKMGPELARRFAITHFFNPPRVMRLLEIVTDDAADLGFKAKLHGAAEVLLGKTVIDCRDTPGFIANRIGCFWMAVSALEARRLGITAETADAVQAALGMPRTGVFGLFDLVGIDLVPHVWGSLMQSLPATDDLHRFNLPDDVLFRTLIANGQFGRKAGAGFYRKAADGSVETLDLQTLQYRQRLEPDPGLARDPATLIADEGSAGRYARSVIAAVLGYAATHAPEIADDIGAIDTAMELGYSWRRGPFALAEMLGLANLMEGIETPSAILSRGLESGFYADGLPLAVAGGRAVRTGAVPLAELPVIAGSKVATLHDLGDGVACFRAHTKMNTFAPEVFDLLEETLDRAGRDFNALVLGNNDPRAFSAGADLGFFLGMIDAPGGTARLDQYVARGQALFLRMMRAPVPVVAAIHGFTLGGGCEFQMHADATIAHAEVNIGLPETGVGLVPGWGGCTRLLARFSGSGQLSPTEAARLAFATLNAGQVASSAAQGQTFGLLRQTDGIAMHRDHVVEAAKARALSLLPGYAAPQPSLLPLAGASGADALLAGPRADLEAGRISETDFHLASVLASILTNRGSETPVTEETMMRLEREALVELTQETPTRERITHMLKTGKRLKN